MSTNRFMNACLAASFGGLLSCILAVPAYSTESLTAESVPVEELIELDEVRVRGRIVANAVITAENRLFRRYNRLNKDDRYDVSCQDVRSSHSLALLRTCIPEFLSRQTASIPDLKSLSTSRSTCGMPPPFIDLNGGVAFVGYCPGVTTSISMYVPPMYAAGAFSPSNTSLLASAPPERVAEFTKTMASVMSSDPELHSMATALAGMYEEVERVQTRFVELQQEKRADQKARREAARASGHSLRPLHPRAP